MNENHVIANKPFDSFRNVNRWLTLAGYCRLYNPRNHWTEYFHKLYRKLVVFIAYVYASQHVIYVFQVHEDTEKLVEGIILAIPEILLGIKVTSLYRGTKKIDKLIELMDDPIFAPNNDEDEKYLKRNTKIMNRLSNAAMIGLVCIAFFWSTGPIFKRIEDPTSTIPSYVPFETNTWPRFLLANFMDTIGVIIWVGFGHLSVDCVIATYYAQAWVQLQIINYNLVHICEETATKTRRNSRFNYVDVLDKSVRERFAYYVKRYERVYWFANEVTSIFNPAISFQFLTTSFASCLAIFQMSSTDTLSMTFGFSFLFYVVNQCQIFLFCYYGGLVEHESKLTADCIYQADWTSLSPKFRRQVLMAMTRWTKPIIPKVTGIIPLSLNTFLTSTRSAYTLFTVLKSSNNKDGRKSLAF